MRIIGAFDRNSIADIEPRLHSVLIMITSKDSNFVKLSDKWSNVLALKFDDIDGKINDIGDADNVLSVDQAKDILDFVIEHINYDIYVSCDAGISRSAGVVVALHQIFNSLDVADRYRFHNKFVKNRIKEVWFNVIWCDKKDGIRL